MYQISYHFLEIRLRFFYLLLSLILTMITSYYYQYDILYIIGRPFLDLDHKFILIDLTEALYTILRICGVLSFLIVMPFFVYHIWSFYIPSRYQFERNIIKKFSWIFFCMLFMEIMALYLVIFPKICEFLLSFEFIPSFKNEAQPSFGTNGSLQNLNQILNHPNLFTNGSKFVYKFGSEPFQLNQFGTDLQSVRNISDNSIFSDIKKGPVLIELTARLESYVKLCTRFYSIMLTIFQIPFFVVILYYYNIIDCYILCKFRKFFIFSSVLISAFISPPDIMSQCLLACFLFFLYELLIFIGIFFEIK